MPQRPSAASHGFTLIEVMIVVAVIAVLAAIAAPNFGPGMAPFFITRMRSESAMASDRS